MLEFGKRYTWDKIVEAYPNKYAFVYDLDIGPYQRINSAILFDVADYEEIGDKARKCREAGIQCSCLWTRGPIQEGLFWF